MVSSGFLCTKYIYGCFVGRAIVDFVPARVKTTYHYLAYNKGLEIFYCNVISRRKVRAMAHVWSITSDCVFCTRGGLILIEWVGDTGDG